LPRSFYLDLYLDLNPPPYRGLFAKSYRSLFRQLFATFFGLMYSELASHFYLLTHDFFHGQVLPPRRPVGRGVDGRIVAPIPAHTTANHLIFTTRPASTAATSACTPLTAVSRWPVLDQSPTAR